MSKRQKKARSRRGLQVVTLCISTTMVLILLGLVVFFVLSAHNLSTHMKEHLTVTVMLKDSVSLNDAKRLCRDLYHRPYSRNIDYVSKAQAQCEQVRELGSDPTEFLGFNPFPATLEIQLKADYANRDSLKWIGREIKKDSRVSDLAYMEDLMNKVNTNLSRVSVILLALALLLTFVSFSLISNTVRAADLRLILTHQQYRQADGLCPPVPDSYHEVGWRLMGFYPLAFSPSGNDSRSHSLRLGQQCFGCRGLRALSDTAWRHGHCHMASAGCHGSLCAGVWHCHHCIVRLAGCQ